MLTTALAITVALSVGEIINPGIGFQGYEVQFSKGDSSCRSN